MFEKEISIDEIKTIREKNGNEGLALHLFAWFHKQISSKMDNKDLKDYLVRVENECDQEAFLFIKLLVNIEKDFRVSKKKTMSLWTTETL